MQREREKTRDKGEITRAKTQREKEDKKKKTTKDKTNN